MGEVYSNPVSGGVIAAGRYRMSPFWRDLPSGWTEIATTGTAPELGMLAYSGMALDSDGGNIYFVGGGHNDSNYSGVQKLNLETRAFSEDFPSYFGANPPIADAIAVTDNTNYPGAIMVGSVPHQPISRHTYLSIQWIKQLGVVTVAGGSTYSGDGDYMWWDHVVQPSGAWLGAPNDFWTYNPELKSFSYKGSARTNLTNFYATRSVVSPIDGTLFTFLPDGNGHLYCKTVDPSSGVTTVRTGLASDDIASSWDGCFDETGRYIYILVQRTYDTGSLRLLKYDIQADTFSLMPVNGGTLPDFTYDEVFTLERSGKTGLVYAISRGDKSLFIYNPVTGVWSAQSLSFLPLFGQTSGRFIFDKRRDCFLLVYAAQHLGVKVYAFRE